MAALFWQLVIGSTGSSTFVALADLAFLDAAGVDVTTGGHAYASSTFSGFDPNAAFDKNTGTRWASAEAAPQSLWYEFPVAVEIAAARITWDANAVYLPPGAESVFLRFSDNGSTWNLAGFGRLVSGTIAASGIATFEFDALHVVDLGSPQHAGDYKTGLLGKGTGTVYGTTEVKGTPNAPLRARVRLIRERDGLVYRETWSDPITGAYQFDNVDELETYTVLTYHPTRDRRAVVADGIIPEVSA